MPRQYGALIGLVQGLLLMRHMLFVGYSLRDEDFHELMYEVRAARGDAAAGASNATVLTLSDDGLERQLWEDDLAIVPMVARPDEEVDKSKAARQLEIFSTWSDICPLRLLLSFSTPHTRASRKMRGSFEIH